ncbi:MULTISPECIES: XisH family protein [unclassified Roseofilum]|uniref:XisH family protein n=1 Tax=unclassified Roseofilum TaxID=2620099 RepID=UPI000E9C8D91|nr:MULTISPECIES: XisH family protein [unclassified Roseofilum]MBP0008465.1 XisH family protein [Roseofilum sp. Belize Diploria]MBP0033230.1 XisH family protein [Roseofilum sp. Belize BBD 4]HBQ99436.1 fatty-acid oxidation protein subunit alpha [Cyanobacteria bacterium UBA11691]
MSAKDRFHDVVRVGLEKEGWTITADPLSLKFGDSQIYIDLGAERILAAEKGEEKIAVEIKTFASDSLMFGFHLAIGQFINYQVALENLEPSRILYLAVPQEIHDTFFQSLLAQSVIQKHQIKLLVYDPPNEVIVRWIT